jgi:hypothetical protein
MNTFSQRYGYEPPNAKIAVRQDALSSLREFMVDLAYEVKLKPTDDLP